MARYLAINLAEEKNSFLVIILKLFEKYIKENYIVISNKENSKLDLRYLYIT